MKVKFSKSFQREYEKLSGKIQKSVSDAVSDVMDAKCIEDIANCIKLTGFTAVYRIRIGSRRAFFVFHIRIERGLVCFEYLVPRGQAYDKKIIDNLKKKDV